MNNSNPDENIDEIDRILLGILSKNPRMSYSSISDRLAEAGHEMSAEGVRHRVRKLLEATSTFFLFAPDQHDWEILRVGIYVANEPDAERIVRQDLSDVGFWLIGSGLGTIDIFASATAKSVENAEELLFDVRQHELVSNIEFSIETHRHTDLENYFSHGNFADRN